MLTILLVVQIIIAVAMVSVILIQRSSSDGLAGLGGGGGNAFMSGRASANLLTKTTSILAVAFMVNSMAMATITARTSGLAEKLIEDISVEEQNIGDVPAEPTVPRAE